MKTSNIRRYVIKITQYALLFSSSLVFAKLTGSLSVEAITERLKPMGTVSIDGASAATTTPATAIVGVGGPKDIYEQNCKMCHQTGLAGAPKFGNKADWQPRIDQGIDVIIKTAWTGIRAMPPKGNCLQCKEDDIKKTVEYMIDATK